ncbi:MAG TPA: hypothetical protein DSN98_06805 [Thermoplasmata archaeon]|nr:MAG TPA: hypothetical protein DSN98_06805 [Thermoplasmata archaeon]
MKGFVVGGCIFDIVDEIWGKTQWKRISDFEEDMEQQYNVYVYRLLRYPPLSGEKKRFLE